MTHKRGEAQTGQSPPLTQELGSDGQSTKVAPEDRTRGCGGCCMPPPGAECGGRPARRPHTAQAQRPDQHPGATRSGVRAREHSPLPGGLPRPSPETIPLAASQAFQETAGRTVLKSRESPGLTRLQQGATKHHLNSGHLSQASGLGSLTGHLHLSGSSYQLPNLSTNL